VEYPRTDSQDDIAQRLNSALSGEILIGLYDYTGRNSELSFRENDQMMMLDKSDPEWWLVRHTITGEEGYVPYNYVTIADSLDTKQWFFGPINRKEAEMLLLAKGTPAGTFLIRERDRDQGYALSVVCRGGDGDSFVKHYKIITAPGKFWINDRRTFESLERLIQHYSRVSDGIFQTLTEPCMKLKPVLMDLSRDLKDQWEIPRTDIQLQGVLGRGQFGEVRKGLWKNSITVAVKTLKPGSMSSESFLEESKIMKKCKHKNLVLLYAVCTIGEPILIVTEYMCNGSLLNYLRAADPSVLNFEILIHMAAQIACGMSYLETNNLIHRDLAARNILVGKENVVKIADFGLARLIVDDEYNSQQGSKFPVKWTAPEAIFKSKFTTKSDVWSFGILMMEILTYGSVPYPAKSNAETIEALQKGYRMKAPPECPSSLNSVLQGCWRQKPEMRPTFEYLCDFFENFFVSVENSYKDIDEG
ncbi:tyrosine-protein kinase Src42A-like isoform X2, partial [Argonauta hians]